MKAPELTTNSPEVVLVAPDVDRDAPLSVGWLDGDTGKNTLLLMGVPASKISPTSLELEKKRVQEFLAKDNQLNWMIKFREKIVGAIWVDLNSTDELTAPAVSIMIGDVDARGRGVGSVCVESVAKYMFKQGESTLYSRMLVKNLASANLLKNQGFKPLGNPYIDDDKLEWQNVSLNKDPAVTNF